MMTDEDAKELLEAAKGIFVTLSKKGLSNACKRLERAIEKADCNWISPVPAVRGVNSTI